MASRSKILSAGLIVVGALLCLTTISRAFMYNPQVEVPDNQIVNAIATSTSAHPYDYPVTISIPAISVYTSVQKVGITYKGNMATPRNYTDAGWYKYGTVPGDVGSSVIAGHVDNGFGTPAVFGRLSELKIGDDIFVTMHDGRNLHFRVTNMETYHYTEGPLERIFHQSDTERLNLITCAGAWIPEAQTNDQRLVVYTTLVK